MTRLLLWNKIKLQVRPQAPCVSFLYCIFGSGGIDYYSTPWERTADFFGGVKRSDGYKKGSLGWSIAQLLLGPIVIPFYFMFGY